MYNKRTRTKNKNKIISYYTCKNISVCLISIPLLFHSNAKRLYYDYCSLFISFFSFIKPPTTLFSCTLLHLHFMPLLRNIHVVHLTLDRLFTCWTNAMH